MHGVGVCVCMRVRENTYAKPYVLNGTAHEDLAARMSCVLTEWNGDKE